MSTYYGNKEVRELAKYMYCNVLHQFATFEESSAQKTLIVSCIEKDA